jgi:8-oxo-dGTP pyrophosphatase MutT (NUDIX family)
MTLAERLRAALRYPHEPELLMGDRPGIVIADRTPAAVLVAVTDRAQPGVILTQRTGHLRRHAGQVAFPGGRIDPGDADAIAAALREAEEEIALPAAAVEIVGEADRYVTVTGFEVTPVVGVIAPDLAYHPSEAEVAEVFEVPLDFLFNPANQIEKSAEIQGQVRHYYEIHWGIHRIWGATAAMLINLSRRLRWA